MRKGKTGGATTVEVSPRWARRKARERRAEERAWKARNGPVIVTKIDQPPEHETGADDER